MKTSEEESGHLAAESEAKIVDLITESKWVDAINAFREHKTRWPGTLPLANQMIGNPSNEDDVGNMLNLFCAALAEKSAGIFVMTLTDLDIADSCSRLMEAIQHLSQTIKQLETYHIKQQQQKLKTIVTSPSAPLPAAAPVSGASGAAPVLGASGAGAMVTTASTAAVTAPTAPTAPAQPPPLESTKQSQEPENPVIYKEAAEKVVEKKEEPTAVPAKEETESQETSKSADPPVEHSADAPAEPSADPPAESSAETLSVYVENPSEVAEVPDIKVEVPDIKVDKTAEMAENAAEMMKEKAVTQQESEADNKKDDRDENATPSSSTNRSNL